MQREQQYKQDLEQQRKHVEHVKRENELKIEKEKALAEKHARFRKKNLKKGQKAS